MIDRLVPWLAAIGVAVITTALAPASAWAEKRVALVVGNAAYQSVPQLPNPSRDANAVAKMFRDAGFDTVETQIDVGNLDFKRAIRRFESISDSGTGAARDRIVDFIPGLDRLDLRGLEVEAADVHYTDGVLSVDADHDGGADFQIAFTNAAEPGAGDFLF